MDTLITQIMVTVERVDICILTHQTVYVNYVLFLVYQLDLNKAGKNNQKQTRLQSAGSCNCNAGPSYSNWRTVKLQGGVVLTILKVVRGILAVKSGKARHG